ncbi:MAG: nuclear transport factor 2 family protein [Burkholderiaceae bacterium]|jgi:ketosteroid isomerase-like protein|nr:nuclear transport factor 2 family protein [Burkholderiaceae bacterium]
MSMRSKFRASAAGSVDEVEAAFYEALQRGDIDMLMRCWADDDEVFCVHPGSVRVVGPSAIRVTFERIFAHGVLHVKPVKLRKVDTLTSAVHSVLERIEMMRTDGLQQAYVLATNVYHRTPQGWRMVAHHASPAVARELGEMHEETVVLH